MTLTVLPFRRKPVTVEAVQWDGSRASADEIIAWIRGHGGSADFQLRRDPVRVEGVLVIETLEGTMSASPLDWIIRGTAGEFYPCKPDIFANIYAVDVGEQPSLFDALPSPVPRPGVRSTDPDTSRDAAESVDRINAARLRDGILAVLSRYGPATDQEIEGRLRKEWPDGLWSPSGLRSRRRELVDARLVEDSGTYGLTAAGRRAIVWQSVAWRLSREAIDS